MVLRVSVYLKNVDYKTAVTVIIKNDNYAVMIENRTWLRLAKVGLDSVSELPSVSLRRDGQHYSLGSNFPHFLTMILSHQYYLDNKMNHKELLAMAKNNLLYL